MKDIPKCINCIRYTPEIIDNKADNKALCSQIGRIVKDINYCILHVYKVENFPKNLDKGN